MSNNNNRIFRGFDVALFVDNDERHIEQMTSCPGVIAYKIPGTEHLPPSQTLESNDLKELISQLPVPNIKPFLAEIFRINGTGDLYDKSSGIQRTHFHEILSWIDYQKSAGKKSIAIVFDFDRTLTLFEGFYAFTKMGEGFEGTKPFLTGILHPYLQSDPELINRMTENFTAQTYMEYLCGGSERLEMLQDLMSKITERGGHLFILTNNPTCMKFKRYMEEMIRVIMGENPYGLLCSFPDKGRKNHTLRRTRGFIDLCLLRQGGRGSKKSKMSKRRRRTHRIK